MPVIKCKMCGGDLNIVEDSTVCECEYCGTKQTVPSADSEKKLTLFARAGRLLRGCEFDKAAGVYESIIADFDQEAEAYWGLILCKFGIEYVDDPATGNKVPTCHRSSFDSLMDDPNFDMVMECADPIARRVYRDEAKAIEELRRGIIEVSSREEPYDVFISYKELAENGERTLDSVIAQDIYTELTDKGYRVFFSRISLESKLGVEYEPYIFAALNSAKVMLAVGTDYDYFNAVWVKNEWSRFLALIARGEKKTLIPVFKGIDANDMPKEFSKLAAQDMGKVGAMQDLVRGVEKILGKKGVPATQPQQIVQQVVQSGVNVDALLKRGYISLEDGDWSKARELFDKVLNDDPENARAYLGLLLAETRLTGPEQLSGIGTREADNNLTIGTIVSNAYYRRFLLYASLYELERISRLLEKPRRLAAEREEAERRRAEEQERLNAILPPEMRDAFEIRDGELKRRKGAEFSAASAVIPESVTSIGESAFSGCSSLTSVTIPEGVTSIGKWAFNCCWELTAVTIPEGVTSIGDYAFQECWKLTAVTIPEGVTRIGESAFSGCGSLTSVTIPESVTSIGESAFSGCRSLTSVTISEGVTSIGESAFEGCRSLTSGRFRRA